MAESVPCLLASFMEQYESCFAARERATLVFDIITPLVLWLALPREGGGGRLFSSLEARGESIVIGVKEARRSEGKKGYDKGRRERETADGASTRRRQR